jgi:hypothetical protein
MHRFSRMHLSPADAIRNLERIELEVKSGTAEVIALIATIDARLDYRAAGFSCMRDFCMERLRLSEHKALRRIQVARAALLFPEVFECLADGRLSTSTAAELVPHLTPETAAGLLAAAAFQPKYAIRRLLAARARPGAEPPAAAAGEAIVQDASGSHAPAHVESLSDLCAVPANGASPREPAPGHATPSRRGRVTPSELGGYEVRLSITDEEHKDLSRAQALLGHAVPSGDPALVYARAMKHYLAHLEKQRLGVKPGAVPATEPRGPGIPKPLRRLVWERDGGRCAFVSADGHRCGTTRQLEIDHVTPLALGGRTVPDNLRVLCRAHNQFEAERVLGKEHVQRRRELAQRDRARAKAADEAARQRAKARDAAAQARRDDLHAALRGLGFRDAEAKRGVAMAEEMPGASLEACLKRVLPELARPVAIRGERMARSTA